MIPNSSRWIGVNIDISIAVAVSREWKIELMRFNPSTVEDLRSKFTAEPGYSAFGELMEGGRRSKHVSRHPKYGVDRSRIPSGEFSRREARMPRFFNNPHPSLFPKFFMELGHSKSWMVVVRIVESLDRPRSVDFLTATLVSFLFPLSLSLERESKLRTFSIF